VAALVGVLAQAVIGGELGAPEQKNILTFAASVSGLPKLAEIYATASADLTYYSQGDLAYALAAATSDRAEIEKYRRLLSVTLESPASMVTMSRANLYYSMGKIDLLLGDKDKAVRDFREAINQNKSMIAEKSKQDPIVHEFLVSNAVH
jgi:tetratricopeptide (TPR) repeat protein